MGLGDLFRRRRERESAIPASSTEASALGSFASAEGQPVVGQQIGAAAGFRGMPANLSDLPGMIESMQALASLGPMIQQALAEGNVGQDPDGSIEIQAGNVNIPQDAQTIEMRGTELGDEIRSIMKQHGIDPDAGAAGQVDAGAMPAMQQQILEALARYGINPNTSGSGQ